MVRSADCMVSASTGPACVRTPSLCDAGVAWTPAARGFHPRLHSCRRYATRHNAVATRRGGERGPAGPGISSPATFLSSLRDATQCRRYATRRGMVTGFPGISSPATLLSSLRDATQEHRCAMRSGGRLGETSRHAQPFPPAPLSGLTGKGGSNLTASRFSGVENPPLLPIFTVANPPRGRLHPSYLAPHR
jgi:hypothetical protein